MSRYTADDQLRFLLSCVKFANNGKIDFVEVARDQGLVSKGAAAKRYERLMRTNGIHPGGNGSSTCATFGVAEPSTSVKSSIKRSLSEAPLKERSKVSIAKAAAAKRRKLEADYFPVNEDDEIDCKRTELTKSEPSSELPYVKTEWPATNDLNAAYPYSGARARLPCFSSLNTRPTIPHPSHHSQFMPIYQPPRHLHQAQTSFRYFQTPHPTGPLFSSAPAAAISTWASCPSVKQEQATCREIFGVKEAFAKDHVSVSTTTSPRESLTPAENKYSNSSSLSPPTASVLAAPAAVNHSEQALTLEPSLEQEANIASVVSCTLSARPHLQTRQMTSNGYSHVGEVLLYDIPEAPKSPPPARPSTQDCILISD